MQQAVTMSTAPPMQPPWMATITGMRKVSRRVKVACMSVNRSNTAARPSGLWSSMLMAPAKVSSDMPALKCLPVLEITNARACPSRFNWSSTSSSSRQNVGCMVFKASGWFSTRWAMWSVWVRAKHFMGSPSCGGGRKPARGPTFQFNVRSSQAAGKRATPTRRPGSEQRLGQQVQTALPAGLGRHGFGRQGLAIRPQALQTAHTHAQQAKTPCQVHPFQALTGSTPDLGRVGGRVRQGLIAGDAFEVVVAQLHANGAPHVALALQVGRDALTQVGEHRAQLRLVVHRVQVA